jgi:hypothetical protein
MGTESIIQWLTQAGPNFPVGATWDHTWNIVRAGFHDLIPSKGIVSSISSAIQNPIELLAFYEKTDPLVSALYFTSGLITIHYVLSEITKNYSQVGKWSA